MANEETVKKQDIVKIITLIKVNYSEAYVGYGEEEMKALIDCWHESLKVYPLSVVNQAVKNTVENSEYAPKLSTVIKEIKTILSADQPSDDELWAELNSVLGKVFEVSRYLAYSQHVRWASAKLDEIYAGLSEDLKLFVVNRSTLIEIAEMPSEALRYERARFFKQMPVLKKHREDKLSAQNFIAMPQIKALPKPENKNKKS